MNFTKEEKKYLLMLLEQSKESLEDCCDEDHIPLVDFISKEDAKEEFEIIAKLMAKLR